MNFDYRRFLVELFDGEPLSEIYRPIVPILVHGPRDSLLVRPILDSGADFTLLPLSVANATGVELVMDRIGTVGGIEGGSLVTYPGEVVLELNDGTQSYRWPTTVRFAAGNNMLIGHLGCLEFFIATLDHHNHTFSLEPNAIYPGQ
ncbi:MAG: hypothetical protein L0228_15190 [Planctomycetes bacterium]|nr:hypothetical protein [Planctomycetota bacterium]